MEIYAGPVLEGNSASTAKKRVKINVILKRTLSKNSTNRTKFFLVTWPIFATTFPEHMADNRYTHVAFLIEYLETANQHEYGGCMLSRFRFF